MSKHGGEKGHNILSIVEIKEACRGADKGEAGERGTGQTRKPSCNKLRSSDSIQ